jgi:hypothetical protein
MADTKGMTEVEIRSAIDRRVLEIKREEGDYLTAGYRAWNEYYQRHRRGSKESLKEFKRRIMTAGQKATDPPISRVRRSPRPQRSGRKASRPDQQTERVRQLVEDVNDDGDDAYNRTVDYDRRVGDN